MAFHVSSEQVDQNVRALARVTGQSITEAINDAVLEKLRRVEPRRPDPKYVEDLLALSERIGKMLRPDSRTPDELVGYDEDGLPV
jgi:antitoxin VapB